MAKYGDAAAAQDERILGDLKLTEDRLAAQHDDLESQRGPPRNVGTRRTRPAEGRPHQRVDEEAARHDECERQVARNQDGTGRVGTHAAVAEQAWLQRLAAKQAAARKKGVGAGTPGDIGAPIGNIPAPTPGALYGGRLRRGPARASRTCTRAPGPTCSTARASR